MIINKLFAKYYQANHLAELYSWDFWHVWARLDMQATIFSKKSLGKGPLERPRLKYEDNINQLSQWG
jgi:hypothetical protein